MSAWKVGQRVRLVSKSANATSQTRVGAEGAILAIGPFAKGHVFPWGTHCVGDYDCVVKWDQGHKSTVDFFRISPLTPPGQKEFKAEDILTMPNLPDFKTMTPEFARAWGGA